MPGKRGLPGPGEEGGWDLSPLSQSNIPQAALVTPGHQELESNRAPTTVLCTAVRCGQWEAPLDMWYLFSLLAKVIRIQLCFKNIFIQ